MVLTFDVSDTVFAVMIVQGWALAGDKGWRRWQQAPHGGLDSSDDDAPGLSPLYVEALVSVVMNVVQLIGRRVSIDGGCPEELECHIVRH